MQRVRGWRVLLVAGLLGMMAVQLVRLIAATSSTWDEPHHLIDGYMILTQGDYRLNPEVPPLVKTVAALPLLGRGLAVPVNHGWSSPKEAFLDGREFVFGNGPGRTLAWGRLACVVFTLGLGLLIFLWTREMFGYWTGVFALAMYCFDPNFLAHGGLITTDVGSGCLFVAAVYAFWRYCRRPAGAGGWGRLVLTGVCCGLLLATKFTGVFIAPMLLLLAGVEGMRARSGRVLLRRMGAVLVVGVLGLVVLWGCYGFRYQAAPAGNALNPTLSAYLEKMYDRRNAGRLAVAARYHVLPEAYLWGLENTKQTEFEDNSYYLGKVYRHGNRGYFPVAMLVKSTVPFLLVLGMGIVGLGWKRRREQRQTRNAGVPALRSSRSGRNGPGGGVWWFLLVPAGIYFAVAVMSDFDIGVRHLLPVYAFLYVALGGVAAALLALDVRWGWLLAGLLGWQVVTSAKVFPAYMAYGNEVAGGPGAVRRYLSDSNVDWGQQLKGVKRYLDGSGAGSHRSGGLLVRVLSGWSDRTLGLWHRLQAAADDERGVVAGPQGECAAGDLRDGADQRRAAGGNRVR